MMNGKKIKNYLEILKLHLCFYIGLSAIFGYAMACRSFTFNALLLGFFVTILACGSAVLNNIQDRDYDTFFVRTYNRSLPQKRVPLFHAWLMALVLIGFGLFGLSFCRAPAPFFFGVMSLICYNMLYTPLKKRTLLAFVPGIICGMIPPLIGWTAAGNFMSDPGIGMIMGVFGLWQIPHFFILQLKPWQHQGKTADLKRFPGITNLFSQNDIKRQVMIWTSLYSLGILLFLMNGPIENHVLFVLSWLNAVGVIFFVSFLMCKRKKQGSLFAFAAINLSMLFFMGTGIYDRVLL